MPENSPSSLDNLHIASPCHASWDAMTGDDKARFCKTCQKNVFNLSLMTRTEAESLIRAKEGNLCVRFAQREDGTILTQDCPVGLERARQQALRPFRFAIAGVAAVLAALSSLFGIAPRVSAQPPIDISRVRQIKGEAVVPAPSAYMMGGPRAAVPEPAVKMGDVAVKCVAPAQDQSKMTMGKPSVVVVQGGLQAPTPPKPVVEMDKPAALHTVLMGEPLPVPAKPSKAATLVKPTAKIKKNVPKTRRAAR